MPGDDARGPQHQRGAQEGVLAAPRASGLRRPLPGGRGPEVGIRKPSIYHHFPGGKETLYAEGTLDYVEELFRAAIDSGTLAGADAGLMGNAFMSMGRATDLTPDAIEETARSLVALFLNGARPR